MSLLNIFGILGCLFFLSWLVYKVGSADDSFDDDEINGGVLR